MDPFPQPPAGGADWSAGRVPAAAFQVRLPDGWTPIDLSDPTQVQVQVEALVAARTGGEPMMVEAGPVLGAQLVQHARDAARAGAWGLVFGQVGPTGADTVPVPVSMVGATVPGSLAGDGLEDLIDAVEERHPEAVLDLLDTDAGPLLRAVRTTVVPGTGTHDAPGTAPGVPQGEGLSLTVVDYWVDLGLPQVVVMVTFTTPSLCFTLDLVVLFEAVLSTLSTRQDVPGTRQDLPGSQTAQARAVQDWRAAREPLPVTRELPALEVDAQ